MEREGGRERKGWGGGVWGVYIPHHLLRDSLPPFCPHGRQYIVSENQALPIELECPVYTA